MTEPEIVRIDIELTEEDLAQIKREIDRRLRERLGPPLREQKGTD